MSPAHSAREAIHPEVSTVFRKMTRERFLSDAELERFMSVVRSRHHVNQPRDHAFFALLANTGMRPSEARALTRDDVNPFARVPWVRVCRPKKRHAAHPITELPLHPAVARVLGRYCQTVDRGAMLFGFTPRQSYRLFRYYAGKAGLEAHFRIYSLRHGVGMRLWRQTGDLRVIQGIMGHVRLKATSCYVHTSPERMREIRATLGTVE